MVGDGRCISSVSLCCMSSRPVRAGSRRPRDCARLGPPEQAISTTVTETESLRITGQAVSGIVRAAEPHGLVDARRREVSGSWSRSRPDLRGVPHASAMTSWRAMAALFRSTPEHDELFTYRTGSRHVAGATWLAVSLHPFESARRQCRSRSGGDEHGDAEASPGWTLATVSRRCDRPVVRRGRRPRGRHDPVEAHNPPAATEPVPQNVTPVWPGYADLIEKVMPAVVSVTTEA